MTETQPLCPSCGCVIRRWKGRQEKIPLWFWPVLLALLLIPTVVEWLNDKLLSGIAMTTGSSLAVFVMLRAWYQGQKEVLLVCVGCNRHFRNGEHSSSIKGTYGRVKIPWVDRSLIVALSVAVISYVAFGLWVDELPVPGFKPWYETTFFYGSAAWLMAAAVLCMVFCWLSFFTKSTMMVERRFVHEYPAGDFKPRYPIWWRIASVCGWVFFLLALLAHVLGI